jgi:hypothetical protein
MKYKRLLPLYFLAGMIVGIFFMVIVNLISIF